MHDPDLLLVTLDRPGPGVVVCHPCLGEAMRRVGPATRAGLRVCSGDHAGEDVNLEHGRYGIVASWPLRFLGVGEPRIYACGPCLRGALDQVAASKAAA